MDNTFNYIYIDTKNVSLSIMQTIDNQSHQLYFCHSPIELPDNYFSVKKLNFSILQQTISKLVKQTNEFLHNKIVDTYLIINGLEMTNKLNMTENDKNNYFCHAIANEKNKFYLNINLYKKLNDLINDSSLKLLGILNADNLLKIIHEDHNITHVYSNKNHEEMKNHLSKTINVDEEDVNNLLSCLKFCHDNHTLINNYFNNSKHLSVINKKQILKIINQYFTENFDNKIIYHNELSHNLNDYYFNSSSIIDYINNNIAHIINTFSFMNNPSKNKSLMISHYHHNNYLKGGVK